MSTLVGLFYAKVNLRIMIFSYTQYNYYIILNRKITSSCNINALRINVLIIWNIILNRFTWTIDATLTGTITPSHCSLGNTGNDSTLPKTEGSPLDAV